MLRIIIICALLAGCATRSDDDYGYYSPPNPAQARCEYEAEIAIQSIANPLYAGVRKAELMGMCMRAQRQ